MLEAIKNALGGELASQVEEALSKANIELAVMNDGTVVKADKHDSLKADHKALQDKYQSDISEVNSKLEQATNNAADYDTLKGTLEEFKANNEKMATEHQQQLLNVRMDKDIDLLLMGENIDPAYLPLVKSQLNKESLSYEGDKLIGGTDLIGTLKEKYPKVFGEIKKVGVNPDNGINPNVGKKAQLIEQYNKAEASKDAKAMMRIGQQIRQIKE